MHRTVIGWGNKMNYIIILLYSILSVSGLVFFKIGAKSVLDINLNTSFLSFKISWLSILGLVQYVLSFLIYMGLVAKNNLSHLLPVAGVFTSVLTIFSAIIIFKEHVTGIQGFGIFLIIFGGFLINTSNI